MAFNKTPMQDTEQTKSIPMMMDWNSRNATQLQDASSQNLVWEIVKNQDTGESYFHAFKRDGLSFWFNVAPAGTIQAIFFANGPIPTVLVCTSTNTYAYNAYSGNVISSAGPPLLATQGHIGFTVYEFDNGTKQVYYTNGTTIYYYDFAGGFNSIGGYPVPHKPYPVYLDGYLFVAGPSGIYNSNLNNPSVWAASDIIGAEAYPDGVEAIARVGNYITAFGTESVEYFYNAANPTGTPLARVDGATKRVGFAGGLAAVGDTNYFIGTDGRNSQSIYRLEGLKIQDVGNATIHREFAAYPSYYDAATSRFYDKGFILSSNGHLLYAVQTRPGVVYMLDISTGLWTRFLRGNDPTMNIVGATTSITSSSNTLMVFTGSNNIFKIDSAVYQDSGNNFEVFFITNNIDFGTRRMKFGSRLLIDADQTTATSNCFVSWTDNDYQTFSTPRAVDLSQTYTNLPSLGSFRKRAWKVTYSDNFPMRFRTLELDYSQGQT